MIKEDLLEISLNNPAKVMEAFQIAGNKMLTQLRNHVTRPNSTKSPRTWGVNEAARMIGTTRPTLAKYLEGNSLKFPISHSESGRKMFTLAQINELRENFGTLYKRPDDSETMILCVNNFKGGCAKTTTAVHLAQKCALDGLRALIIDFDPQGTSTFICGGIIPDLEISPDNTIERALFEDPSDIERIIIKTHFPGLDLIPGNLALQDIELGLPNNSINNFSKLGNPAFRLEKALGVIKNKYDVILIDCGPNLGILTLNAITSANSMLIPLAPNMFDYASFVMLTHTLQNLFEAIPGLKFNFFRIMLSKHSGTQESNYVESMLRKIYGNYVLNNHMCDTVEIAKATNDLGSVYEVSRPRGSREAYRRAITHLDGVNNEIIELFKKVWDLQTNTNIKNGEQIIKVA
ncbi:MAG: AAA family ATPase [Legionellales bacterium]|nr:AAA family ATPase [Legionellales bacterium]